MKVKMKNLQRKYQCLLKRTKSISKHLEITKKICLLQTAKKYLRPVTFVILAMQVRMSGRKNKGDQWTSRERSLTLALLVTTVMWPATGEIVSTMYNPRCLILLSVLQLLRPFSFSLSLSFFFMFCANCSLSSTRTMPKTTNEKNSQCTWRTL